jgi:hypothetical protein
LPAPFYFSCPALLQRVLDSFAMEQCLIFCRTNHDCDNLEQFLTSLGELSRHGTELALASAELIRAGTVLGACAIFPCQHRTARRL